MADDAKVVLDVWSKRAGADRDEFLGKVTIRLESALRKPEVDVQVHCAGVVCRVARNCLVSRIHCQPHRAAGRRGAGACAASSTE